MRHQIEQIAELERGGKYKVSIQIPCTKGWIEHVKFYIWKFGKQRIFDMNFTKNDQGKAHFEVEVELEDCPLYQYYFSFEANGIFQYFKKKNITGNTNVTIEECYKMSVNFNVPEWAKGCIAYQIFPDRFHKGKGTIKLPMPRRKIHESWDELPIIGPDEQKLHNIDFFGGDFVGIKEKVPYIASLGIDMVYLNPIVTSQSNHRYDAADYMTPDPYLGTEEELKDMIQEFHNYGIKVVLDGVFNHTGNDSIYFNQYGTYNSIGAYQSPESPYSSFYIKAEKGKYLYWWDFLNLPVCDKSDLKYRNFIFGEGGVIDKWCEWGIDGLRLDVVDELPNDFTMGLWEAMQRNLPNNFIIFGEVWENAMRKERNYIKSGKEIHTVMNYFLTDALLRYYKYGDVFKLDTVIKEILKEYPTETIQTLMNSTSTHDMSRLIEVLGCDVFDNHGQYAWSIKNWEDMTENERIEWQRNHKMTREEYEYGKVIMKSYLTALAFLPGIFTIFYGDEVGVKGIGNLFTRGTYPWGKEDKEILSFYENLLKSRKNEQFLKKADIRIKNINHAQFVYERYDENHSVLVITSRVNQETPLIIPEEYENAEIIFSTEGNGYTTLAPYGAMVLKK